MLDIRERGGEQWNNGVHPYLKYLRYMTDVVQVNVPYYLSIKVNIF